MRKGRVGTNELSGKYICLGDKRSSETELTFTQEIKDSLKGGLVEKLEELEKNNNRGGNEKRKTDDGKNIFFLSER